MIKEANIRIRPLQDFLDVKIIIAESEIFAIHQKESMTRPQDFGTNFLGQTLAGAPAVDASTRVRVDVFTEQSGLKLPEHLQAQLYAATPYAFAMAHRIRRGFEKSEEPYCVSGAPAWNGQRGPMEHRVDQRDKASTLWQPASACEELVS